MVFGQNLCQLVVADPCRKGRGRGELLTELDALVVWVPQSVHQCEQGIIALLCDVVALLFCRVSPRLVADFLFLPCVRAWQKH